MHPMRRRSGRASGEAETEYLDGSKESVSFPRPMIELSRNGVAASLRDGLHRAVLGDVSTYETIGVLVRASFPGMVRRGEVEHRACAALDLTIAVELGSVVDGDGLEEMAIRSDELRYAPVGVCNGSRLQLAEQHTSGCTFDESDNAVAIDGTNDRVHLPMANVLTALHCSRTLGNVAFAGESAALLGAGVTLPPLARLSEKPEELTVGTLIAANVSVNRLPADGEATLDEEPAADLLGTEPLAQQAGDEAPVAGRELRVPSRSRTSSIRSLLGCAVALRPVVA